MPRPPWPWTPVTTSGHKEGEGFWSRLANTNNHNNSYSQGQQPQPDRVDSGPKEQAEVVSSPAEKDGNKSREHGEQGERLDKPNNSPAQPSTLIDRLRAEVVLEEGAQKSTNTAPHQVSNQQSGGPGEPMRGPPETDVPALSEGGLNSGAKPQAAAISEIEVCCTTAEETNTSCIDQSGKSQGVEPEESKDRARELSVNSTDSVASSSNCRPSEMVLGGTALSALACAASQEFVKLRAMEGGEAAKDLPWPAVEGGEADQDLPCRYCEESFPNTIQRYQHERYLCRLNTSLPRSPTPPSTSGATWCLPPLLVKEEGYRPRSMLTDQQKDLLESQYLADPWPNKQVLAAMASRTGLSRRVIQVGPVALSSS